MEKGEKKIKEKESKPVNKAAKFIWFAVSIVVLAVGVILVKSGISFDNYVLKAVYAVAVLFPLLVAAQKTSCERVKEDGKKNIPAIILYYIFIVLFVVFIPFIFWVDQFVSLG